MDTAEEQEIVIVGGGICGLATALALHRKGIKSLIIERSEKVRATGAAIIIQPNGWLALEQLGVAKALRETTIPIRVIRSISLGNNKQIEFPIGEGELRSVKRYDLIKVLSENLPLNTIRLNCEVLSIKFDRETSNHVLDLADGNILRAKLVIGCDGINSCVGSSLGLNSTRRFSLGVTRGLTYYEDGHEFGDTFVVIKKNHVQLGRMPINDKLVYWFLVRQWDSKDLLVSKNLALIRQSAMESVKDFQEDVEQMIRNCDLNSLHLTDLRYRSPHVLLFKELSHGNLTVAGDAMHAMAPFLAQGGSASLEDAVILARCLAQNTCMNSRGRVVKVKEALDQYTKERRMRVVKLCVETFLIGKLLDPSSSILVKILCIISKRLIFSNPKGHTEYNCGSL